MDGDAIKSMPLYCQVERIFNDLRQLGIGDGDPLTVEILSRFDQYHYFGTAAVDEAIRALGLGRSARVLEVGSGLGGPARYLAQRTGCRVTAVELQPDLDRVAASLTRRCGLAGRVDHVCADILAAELPAGRYDAVVSWLSFYHIAERPGLFARCLGALAAGGRLYAEDLFRHRDFDREEQHLLRHQLFGQCLPRRPEYIAQLRAAGFADIRFTDLTESWKAFVVERRAEFRRGRAGQITVHGPEIVAGLDDFYDAVALLFACGKLGGVRLTARKP